MPSIGFKTIEFHRFGSAARLMSPDNQYIRTAGWDAPAKVVSPTVDHEDIQRSLNSLRYVGAASEADMALAQTLLSKEAVHFLPDIAVRPGELVQLDIVTNAAELWTFPFEAGVATQPWLESADQGVVVTRRIRGDFSETATPWPATPRVLFVHAPISSDLDEQFIDSHVKALETALEPWSQGKSAAQGQLLNVREIRSVGSLKECAAAFKPTYVHLLAHGAVAPGDPLLPAKSIWGVRLGGPGERGVLPEDIAGALRPVDGLPLVITLAVCDSANSGDPVFGTRSVVQEIHRNGVPVVIGSQLPLTQPGSRLLTEVFYSKLLEGDDVRVALHVARRALKGDKDSGHDWLSLVGYVRLPPEGYAMHLKEVALRMELRMLDAPQVRADNLSKEVDGPIDVAEFESVERQLLNRLTSLKRRRVELADRKDLEVECAGLEASAYKRLAELRFMRGLRSPTTRETDWQLSRDALESSLMAYRTAFQAHWNSHWVGIQQLALDAALTGTMRTPTDWLVVKRTAQFAHDSSENEYWAAGTLIELLMLGPLAGQPWDMAAASAICEELHKRARRADDQRAIASTRRQIARYVKWWTTGHGYFPGRADLSADASALLRVFDSQATVPSAAAL